MILMKSSRLIGALSLAFTFHVAGIHAQTADLSTVTIEDLMKIHVTSVSKKDQELFGTPSAVYVLTNEIIRRSGATTIPDALRLVPGIQVAQIDANKWAITARGFNGLWANKLLVLVDGRAVYTMVSGGVYWDAQDFILEDVDRIEVIRGPGSTVWGANAVNGVVNIITKSSESTQGVLATVSTGTADPGIASFRFGGRAGTHGSYRLFMKQSNHGEMTDGFGQGAANQSHLSLAGFRSDLNLTAADSLTVQGSILNGASGQRVNFFSGSDPSAPPLEVSEISPMRSGSLVARWQRTSSSHSNFSAQMFWDRNYRRLLGVSDLNTQTFDLSLEHHFTVGTRHDLVWGAGQRFWSDREEVVLGGPIDPPSSRIRVSNAFIQDELTLVPDRVRLTLGSKVEHDTIAAIEFEPSARMTWFATARQNVWGAVSRAARTPSRIERAVHIDYPVAAGPNGEVITVSIRGGGASLKTEHTVAYQAGYRAEPHSGLAFDITSFYNVYDKLLTVNAVTPLLSQYGDGMSGRSYGMEALARWQATRDLAGGDPIQPVAYCVEGHPIAHRRPRPSARSRPTVAGAIATEPEGRMAARCVAGSDRPAGVVQPPRLQPGGHPDWRASTPRTQRHACRAEPAPGHPLGVRRLRRCGLEPGSPQRVSQSGVAVLDGARHGPSAPGALCRLFACLLATAVGAALAARPAIAQSASIDDVKAAFLFNFTKFVRMAGRRVPERRPAHS